MGMAAFFTPISGETLAELKADPGKLEALLFPDEQDGDGDVEPAGTVDIDKAWHGIHYLLCEIAGDGESPLAAAVLGGLEIGEDLGYGPPRLLEPEEVRAVSAALSEVSVKQLEEAFDPGAMSAADIYPDIWERDGEEALDYLTHYFPALVAFYGGAASRGDGVILYLA